ncbi:MAG TPA: hypothetical protein VFZ24_16255 [Longimicrobiales bacterium]
MATPSVGSRDGTAERVAFLSDPDSYAEGTGDVEKIETHMAFVFLTDAHAYKLKKPVRYEFLDFSTLPLRRRTCEDEVRLNRRLAPDVYIGAVPLVRDAAGALHIGAVAGATIVDWLVKMKRLPRDRMLDAVIRAGGPTARELESLGALLVRFYRNAPAERIPPDDYIDRLDADITIDIRELAERADHLPFDLIRDIGAALGRALALNERMLRSRAVRIREVHGDLRPEHICLTEPPVIIDCLEFRRDFRLLDPADELAFLGMECERLGAPHIGRVLLRHYRESTGDRLPPGLVEFYGAMRALLRGKLAIWHLRNGDPAAGDRWTAAAHEYLRLAARHLGVPITQETATGR